MEYQFEWHGSCRVRVLLDADLFGFVGLKSRGSLGRRRHFLGMLFWEDLLMLLGSLGPTYRIGNLRRERKNKGKYILYWVIIYIN